MLRRGTSYGPPLPEGTLEDDGLDRGLMFLFIGAHLRRQFEFVQSVWINDGEFIGASAEKDPLVGASGGVGAFTIPRWPVRRRLQGLPQFVVTRGGEYCFMPGLRALEWLTPLPSQTNFVLCRVTGRDARGVKQALERQGVLVRYFDRDGLRDCLRITVGLPEHTDRLVEALTLVGRV